MYFCISFIMRKSLLTKIPSMKQVVWRITYASFFLRICICIFSFQQTLDQLPLTNPEHFGTPVIGKKTNRGRRSNHM